MAESAWFQQLMQSGCGLMIALALALGLAVGFLVSKHWKIPTVIFGLAGLYFFWTWFGLQTWQDRHPAAVLAIEDCYGDIAWFWFTAMLAGPLLNRLLSTDVG